METISISKKGIVTKGQRFGNRVVLSTKPGRTTRGEQFVSVRCDCGFESTIMVADLKRGRADRCTTCARRRR